MLHMRHHTALSMSASEAAYVPSHRFGYERVVVDAAAVENVQSRSDGALPVGRLEARDALEARLEFVGSG